MFNLSPNDKKLLALFLLVAVIFFSVFIIDFFLSTKNIFDISETINATDTIEEALKKISSKSKNPQPSMIRKSLSEIFELMNNNDYEELFKLVSGDLKKYMFNDDLAIFSEFMSSYSDKEYSPYFTKYERFDNMYMVLVSFVPYSNTDEDIINTKKPEKSDTFFLHYSDDDTYSFSFLGFVGEKQMGNGVENSQFRVILNKTVLYKNKSEFHFTITNNSTFPIQINSKDIFCYTGVKPRFYPYVIYVSPGSSTDFTFSVGTGLSISNAVPSEINFKNILVNGTKYSFSIPTDFCINL